MKMYIWESKMLMHYADGYIVAVASSPEEAKKKILDAAPAYLADNCLFGYDPEDDAERLEEFMNKLKKDLEGVCRVDEVAFFKGSD